MKGYITKLEFERRFDTDEKCLDMLLKIRLSMSQQICCGSKDFRYVNGTMGYKCRKCNHQYYPMSETIMRKSTISIALWFQVAFEYMSLKCFVSSTAIMYRYGLTAKAAYRMLSQIRSGMIDYGPQMLSGKVHIDESFFGGIKPIEEKQIVFGMIERDGRARMRFIEEKDAATIRPIIDNNIAKGSTIYHDGNGSYGNLKARGYNPKKAPAKSSKSFRRHNNNPVEALWNRCKRFYRFLVHISDDHLQSYLDAFCYCERESGEWLFNNLSRSIFDVLYAKNVSQYDWSYEF